MDYSIKNKTPDTLKASEFQLLWLSSNPETTEKKIKLLDVDLKNLQRAYNLPLGPQENIAFPEAENAKTNYEEEGDEEEDWADGHDPMEFCESLIIEGEDVSLSQNINNLHKCCYCSYEGSVLQLRNHTMYSHPSECIKISNWCIECKIHFENESAFREHISQEHAFCCSQCNKTFKKQKLLLAHFSVHTEKKHFKCPTCGKIFSIHRYFMRHLERHERKEVKQKIPIPIHKCTMCPKEFTKKESLAKHTKIHTRDLLKCSLCEFTCEGKVTLKMHFISHEGNRKYKCNRCDFSFKQIGHLKRHIERFNH